MSDDAKVQIAWALVAAVGLASVAFAAKSCTEADRAAYVACIQATGKPLECERMRVHR